jgi:hypothetical protein
MIGRINTDFLGERADDKGTLPEYTRLNPIGKVKESFINHKNRPVSRCSSIARKEAYDLVQ